jgi:acetyl-CoA C-acetyltransferase
MVATKYGLDREALDRFALNSHQRAATATKAGRFAAEIVPVMTANGPHLEDEGIRYDATLESIASVKLLQEDGVISPANASQICDGASAVLVVNERALNAHNLTPLARIVNLTVTAGDPVIMLEEPLFATATSTCSRSTRPLPPFRSPGSKRSMPTRKGSMLTAAQSRSAIRSARVARN